MQNPLMQISS